jgi:hypothetical protein
MHGKNSQSRVFFIESFPKEQTMQCRDLLLLQFFSIFLWGSSALAEDFKILTEEYPPYNFSQDGEI